MKQVVSYLEELGYQVEEQSSKSRHFLIILQELEPIGFLFEDYSIKLLQDEEQLLSLISFVKEYQDCQTQGKDGYILATYLKNSVTAKYDAKNRSVVYVTHYEDENILPKCYPSQDHALRDFVIQSGMVPTLLSSHRTFRQKLEDKLFERLWERRKEG